MTVFGPHTSSVADYQFPFQDLDLRDFLKTIGSWIHQSIDRLSNKIDLYGYIIESPNREDPLKC